DAVHGVRSLRGELLREVEESDPPASGAEFSVAVFGARAQFGARERRGDLDQLGDEELDRASRSIERAQAAPAVADDGHVPGSLVEADPFGSHTQTLAEDARERGLVALAGRLRHGIHVQRAVAVEARMRLVLGRNARGARLEERRHADAAQPALSL